MFTNIPFFVQNRLLNIRLLHRLTYFLSTHLFVIKKLFKKLFIIFCMMLPSSLILLELDFLLRETAASNSERMEYRVVLFLVFLFPQMISNPVVRIVTIGRRKGSSASISKHKDFFSVQFLPYDWIHLKSASPAKLYFGKL